VRGPPLIARLLAAYRRAGGDLPWTDPRPTHRAEMEGWFWRWTDDASGVVVVALCGVNQHPAGAWATVALAAHPGGFVASAAVDGAWASADRLEVRAGNVFVADERSVRVVLDGARLEVDLEDLVGWPLRLGAGGLFSALPWLGQYWHPHVLGGRARGHLSGAGREWALDGAQVYAEKNWGHGFPDRWWWGQAQGFRDPTTCVAFGGGRLAAGPLGLDVTGLVLRTGPQVLRFAPPLARVAATVQDRAWRVDARYRGWQVTVDGEPGADLPAILPVPLAAARTNVQRDIEHLAGRLVLRVWHRGVELLVDETSLAGLEVGSVDAALAARLADEAGVGERSAVRHA
jgi:tocopherol cyclase